MHEATAAYIQVFPNTPSYADSWELSERRGVSIDMCLHGRHADNNYGLSKWLKAWISQHNILFSDIQPKHSDAWKKKTKKWSESEELQTRRIYMRRMPFLPLARFKWIDQMTRTWKPFAKYLDSQTKLNADWPFSANNNANNCSTGVDSAQCGICLSASIALKRNEEHLWCSPKYAVNKSFRPNGN